MFSATQLLTVNGKEKVHLKLERESDPRFRSVTVTLDFFGRDDEWGEDETITAQRLRVFPLGPGQKLVVSKKKDASFLEFAWGGECRAEYKLILRTLEDNSVEVGVKGRFFEGITEGTKEQEDSFGPTTFVVPPDGKEVSHFFSMDNEGEDRARVNVTVTDEEAP